MLACWRMALHDDTFFTVTHHMLSLNRYNILARMVSSQHEVGLEEEVCLLALPVIHGSSSPLLTVVASFPFLLLQVEALARSVLRDPLHITVGERNTAQVCRTLRA